MPASIRLVRRSALVRYLALAYAAVVLCASLYPFAGWRLPGAPQLWGRLAEWPRYYTWADVLLNVAAYAPLGFLLTLWLRSRRPPMVAATLALFAAVVLSFCMEVVQVAIPPRVPSSLDLFCNGVGALVGAWIALAAGEVWLRRDALLYWRQRHFSRSHLADAGIALLGLWLVAQLDDVSFWMFGSGDLRQWLPDPPIPYTAWGYMVCEAVVAAAGLMTIFAIAGVVGASRTAVFAVAVVVLALAVVLKSLAIAWVPHPGRASTWLTPGITIGFVLGMAGGALQLYLSPGWRRAAVGLAALLAGVLLLNVAPANPYLSPTGQAASGGHLWSFGGATRIISLCWPVAAAGFFAAALFRSRRSAP